MTGWIAAEVRLDIDADVAAGLQAQVAAGAFGTVEEALRAAVFGAPLDIALDQDLS
jgi:2-hydroxychromene-2-carboxylate isomerase